MRAARAALSFRSPRVLPRNTLATVELETPALVAMSYIVTGMMISFAKP
jgi:hypothetical protein